MLKLDKERLIHDLKAAGVEVSSINDLMKMKASDRELIPIILRHLQEINDETDKEFLVRCLGVKGFYEATRTLLVEFRNASNLTYKWAIGNSLSIIRDRSAFDEYVSISRDRNNGISRQMIVVTLGLLKDERAIPVLIELLNDPDVAGHAISALSNFPDPAIIPHLRPFLESKVKWIRNEAGKSIAKIERLLRDPQHSACDKRTPKPEL